MALFSERYGYIKPREAFIKDCMPEDVQNMICSALDELRNQLIYSVNYSSENQYKLLERHIWIFFLNQRKDDFRNKYDLIQNYVKDEKRSWYRRIDIIEECLIYLTSISVKREIGDRIVVNFISFLNSQFKRLHYGYQIIDKKVIPITSEEEITAIESAIANNTDNVREHLHNALALFAKRPEADYRNSIKESISAVEAFLREQTGKNTLGDALTEMENKQVVIPRMLTKAFKELYAYTNSKDTGIRHALMDDSGTYTPSFAEAQFMLVSCSAFLNYLKMKIEK